ncbi:MAG: AAA family ATPase [Jatrophihabitantaceae bacterium]
MRTRSTVLIGRAAELATLTRWLHEPGRARAGFCLGMPGVGKSRLVAEAAAQAAAGGLVVVHGRASSIGPVSPLRPFAEALAALHRRGLLPEDDLGGYRPLLGRVVPQVPGPGRLGIGEAVPTVAFAEAVLRVLAAVAAPAGCLLVLEDLQDADPESMAVLDYLIDHIAGTPIAIVGALREEPADTQRMLAAAQQRGMTELVPIRPLDREDTARLMAACLGSEQPLDDDLVELAWHHGNGNPLLVEELLYDLIDTGQLHRDGERWSLPSGPALAPPPSMLQLIAARLERLAGLTRQLVVTAAVYGDHFPLPAVQAALEAGEVEFGDAIGEATAAQLIVAAEPGWCRFHHPLSHAAVLELAPVAERRQSATRLAEAVLAEDPERTGLTCRLAGRLLVEAGKPRAAGELYARAGREAHRTGALEWAVADLTEAVRLLPAEESLIDDLVTALLDTWQLDRALKLVERLLPPPTGPGRERRALTLFNLTWGCIFFASRPQEAQQQLASAQTLSDGTGSELARIHCDVLEVCVKDDRSSWQAMRAAMLRARTAAEAAERFARTAAEADERRSAAEAACRGWITVYILSGEGCGECFERISALAEEHNLPGWRFNVTAEAAIQQMLADGDVSLLEAVQAQAQQLGMVGQALALETNIWCERVQLADGSLAPVLAGLTSCLEQARRLRNTGMERYALSGLVLAAGFRADEAALAEATARFEAAGGHHMPVGAITMGLASTVCLALEGRDREALATLQDMARQRLVGAQGELAPPYALMQLLGTITGTIQPAEVAAALETASRQRWCRQFLHAAAAVHAGRQGDRSRADQHAAQARAAAEAYPVTRHLIARLVAPAAAPDGWGSPIEDLRAAEAWFHQQGVAPAARSCRDVLRALGASVPQRRAGTEAVPAELRTLGVTAREYEVGQLVAEHLGNRAIGERLHISPRTVEKHTAALISKLAVPDRHAIIGRLTDHHYSSR